MNFVQEYPILDIDLQKRIVNYLDKDERDFEDSLLYEAASETKLIDTNRRLSVFKTFTDEELFKMCEQLVEQINAVNEDMQFSVVKNDVTYIKYSDGGFFKPHEDYLSLTSNFIEEYTLLMCVDADCVGGETILHFNNFFQYPSKSSVTPGHFLLFRKDLKHEGARVNGTKSIVMLNLWSIKVDSDIVVVSFADSGETYTLPYNSIVKNRSTIKGHNTLETFVEFQKKTRGESKIYYYHETQFSYDKFAVVADIFNNKAISYKDVEQHRDILDFFGFNIDYLLIKDFVRNCPLNGNFEEEDDLYLFGDESRYTQFLEMVKCDKLPYVPFEMLFVDGANSFGGGLSDCAPIGFKMDPVWLSFSENNNVLFFYHLFSTNVEKEWVDLNPLTIKLRKEFDRFATGSDVQLLVYDDPEDDNQICIDESKSIKKINLSLCLDGNLSDITRLLSDRHGLQFMPLQKNGGFDIEDRCEHYCLDKSGELCLDDDQLQPVLDRICECSLLSNVKDRIKKIDFKLPQTVNASNNEFFCNENVYGHYNFLIVYGFLKME